MPNKEAIEKNKLKDGLIRNETKWPEIFGLTEDEVLEIMEAVRQYSLIKNSQSYQDWCKMYNGIHRESTFEQDCRNWFACIRNIKQGFLTQSKEGSPGEERRFTLEDLLNCYADAHWKGNSSIYGLEVDRKFYIAEKFNIDI
jgi:hypothetical protein